MFDGRADVSGRDTLYHTPALSPELNAGAYSFERIPCTGVPVEDGISVTLYYAVSVQNFAGLQGKDAAAFAMAQIREYAPTRKQFDKYSVDYSQDAAHK